MIDLRNIAQQLRLPAEQLRFAADLLEQGYQPAFIARHRADETGHLPGSVLWAIKFALERERQLDAARQEALAHLGEGVELDEEAQQRIEGGQSITAIDVAMRCFRSRRAARQSGDRTGQASQLLEKMIAAQEPIVDLPAWTAQTLAVDPAQVESLLQQASRLVATLLAGDTRLFERMRQAIQKKAVLRVEILPEPSTKGKSDREATADASGQSGGDSSHDAAAEASELSDHDGHDAWAHADDDLVGDHDHDAPSAPLEVNQADTTPETDIADSSEPIATEQISSEQISSEQPASVLPASELPASELPASEQAGDQPPSAEGVAEQPPISLSFETAKKSREARQSKRKGADKTPAKAAAKLTPRQRRRRWLSSVLQPLKSLKKPMQRLTAYQMLMIGRGQRSQLIKVDLEYDRRQLVNISRDVFVPDSHPLSKWFAEAADQALSAGLSAKAESDALAEQDELAQQKLLEAATDQLRASLLQRPVKGHRILVIDTVGPNSACVAVIDARGRCIVTQEVVCTALPSVVSQNVIMLGELVHKHKVTLVAISNGPARRFLIHTVVELMKQSASSNLRWTMVDRGGAEAYATSKQASVDFPQLNRRFRAAVWLGRRLQDPLGELLKLDPTRLRLGSYQRELPQEPLKRLVTTTLSDCLCVKGLDARYASEQQFSYVPGVTPEIASKLAEMGAKREFTSREALMSAITEWPETGRRQALGFIRIYQSPQTLDGTLIHPDDYHLAQRLIDNTELVAPPAAPEGWLPPKIKLPKQPKSAANEVKEATSAGDLGDLAGQVNEPTDATEVTDQTPGETTATGSADGQVAPSPAPDEPIAETTNGTLVGSESEAEASAQAASAESSSENSPAADSEPVSEADSSEAGTAAEEPAAATASKPEYSEEVVTEQSAPPAIDSEKLARGWQVGRAKLAFLANCLSKPFGDSRDKRPPVPMLTSVPTLTDLQPGMCVYAIVVGVAEFGAFVELGPDCGGLIHISRLSADYIEDPHQAVQIGDLVQAWVVSVDVDKKRVALTALSPEQQRRVAEDQREQESRRHEGRSRGQAVGQAGRGQGTGHERSGQERSGQERGQGGKPSGDRSSGDGRRQDRGDRPGRSGPGAPGRGAPGRGAPGRGAERGRSDGGRGDGRGRGGRRDETSRPVVVKSKKPAAPITEAMKKGQEPLRSFSDLLQFYEVKRTDASPPTVTPVKEAPPVVIQETSVPTESIPAPATATPLAPPAEPPEGAEPPPAE